MNRITIVEDETFMREELANILEKAGYEVYQICSFQNMYEDIVNSRPDLVLLDINLPTKSGFEICKQLKNKNVCPVIVLTSRTHIKDEIHGLKLGADDFLTKPYHKERLLARIENILRRFPAFESILKGNGFYLDKNTYTLYKESGSKVLPENEGKILEALLEHPGEIVSKKYLFEHIWGTQEYVDENILQVNITRLRKSLSVLKLEDIVHTVRGKGYVYNERSSGNKMENSQGSF